MTLSAARPCSTAWAGLRSICTSSWMANAFPAGLRVDVDRTSADGKASSVQFVHFELTDAQADKMKQANTRAILGIDHENYAHMAVIPESARAELAGDLD